MSYTLIRINLSEICVTKPSLMTDAHFNVFNLYVLEALRANVQLLWIHLDLII
jgi:hypothetical protein